MEYAGPSSMTKKESFSLRNNLTCLAKALENRYTTVDLRNETSVTGKIEEVDGYMNIAMSDAALFDTDGNYRYFPILHIQSRNIRDIIIPDNIPIIKSIKSKVMREPPAQSKMRTFKESRARRQQQETVELIRKMKEQESRSRGDK